MDEHSHMNTPASQEYPQSLSAKEQLRLMDKILHYLKDPKLWELNMVYSL